MSPSVHISPGTSLLVELLLTKGILGMPKK